MSVSFYYDERANRKRGGYVVVVKNGNVVTRTDLLSDDLDDAAERARREVAAKFPITRYAE